MLNKLDIRSWVFHTKTFCLSNNNQKRCAVFNSESKWWCYNYTPFRVSGFISWSTKSRFECWARKMSHRSKLKGFPFDGKGHTYFFLTERMWFYRRRYSFICTFPFAHITPKTRCVITSIICVFNLGDDWTSPRNRVRNIQFSYLIERSAWYYTQFCSITVVVSNKK